MHVTRHPMDAGLAMYKQLFADAYPWSYDLTELGQYYVQYHQLMQEWQKLLQERMVSVNYDALVAAPEVETRALLQGLQLPFEDACLRPHRTQGSAATASAAQVREPIHRRSSGRWQEFAAQLQPYRDILEAAGIPVRT